MKDSTWIEMVRDSYVLAGDCKRCGQSKPVNKYGDCEFCDKVMPIPLDDDSTLPAVEESDK